MIALRTVDNFFTFGLHGGAHHDLFFEYNLVMHSSEIYLSFEIKLLQKPNFNQSPQGYRFHRFGLRKIKFSLIRAQCKPVVSKKKV